MKFIKKLSIVIVTMSIAFSFMRTDLVYAVSRFKDVKESHWAYNAISFVSNKGYIVGDSVGNFKPNDFMDKFETVKILSRVSGYKYNNATEDDIAYYKKIYDKNFSFIIQFDKAFKKWNPTADKEIAYLLEKEILVSEDLNQFVLKTQEGEEKLRALSREEAAMFIAKLIGFKKEALSFTPKELFQDDANISETTKPYVYYLKDRGVFSSDDNGKFNPKTPVTRAVMATILDRALALENANYAAETKVINNDLTSTHLETLTGKIDKYFPTLTALQVISDDGKKNIYKLAKSNTIYIDGFIKKAEDLTEGMPFVAVLNNSEIVDIRGNSFTKTTEVEPVTNIQKSTLEGTISNKSDGYISIQIKILSPKGDVTKEVRTYKIDKELEIKRGSKIVELSDINVGDIVNAVVSTTTIYEINLDEVDLRISGTLLEKKFDTENQPLLVIQTKDGIQYSLQTTIDSLLTRKGFGEVKYTQLKIGDTVDVQAKYNKIIDLYAYGTKTTVDGTIEEIYIGNKTSKITIKIADGTLVPYTITQGIVDLYSLKLGSKVKIKLDSLEIESIVLISVPATSFLTGFVGDNKNNTITVLLNDIETRDVTFNKDTVFIDSFTGNRVEPNFVTKNMKIYVVFQDGKLNLAKTITVLTKG